ncbi:hypothetical protein TUM17377_39120 [Shewanella chilikensis]|nr:hypothetical protein TUM17377_39120 [Shewanella chilikensis]
MVRFMRYPLLLLTLLCCNPLLADEATETQLMLGWDSRYISEGRDNLSAGGIAWSGIHHSRDGLGAFVLFGRADSVNYAELNAGVEYCFNPLESVEAGVGMQRLEFYGDERGHDNEVYAYLAYQGLSWLTPSINYTYATEASGYFVELSLHSHWQVNEQLTLTPYVTQGFDFGYASQTHDGPNHLQFGVEACYSLTPSLVASLHLSHSIAQDDIKQQAQEEGWHGDLAQSYAGLHLEWQF